MLLDAIASVLLKVPVYFVLNSITLRYQFVAKTGFIFYGFNHAEEIISHFLCLAIRCKQGTRKASCFCVLILLGFC